MAGTKAGAQAAKLTNEAKYGKDFYSRIGTVGGRNGHTGGFFANRELARTAGAIGGANSIPYSKHPKVPAPVARRSGIPFLRRLHG